VGPFLGGWLIDTFSWRWVFFINVPLAVVAVAITLRHVPESRATTNQPIDGWGALLAALGLTAVCWALIESDNGVGASQIVSGVIGGAAIFLFLLVESRRSHPLLPLRLFRHRPLRGTNRTTLAVYAPPSAPLFVAVLALPT